MKVSMLSTLVKVRNRVLNLDLTYEAMQMQQFTNTKFERWSKS